MEEMPVEMGFLYTGRYKVFESNGSPNIYDDVWMAADVPSLSAIIDGRECT
jgi:hypothetical protein